MAKQETEKIKIWKMPLSKIRKELAEGASDNDMHTEFMKYAMQGYRRNYIRRYDSTRYTHVPSTSEKLIEELNAEGITAYGDSGGERRQGRFYIKKDGVFVSGTVSVYQSSSSRYGTMIVEDIKLDINGEDETHSVQLTKYESPNDIKAFILGAIEAYNEAAKIWEEEIRMVVARERRQTEVGKMTTETMMKAVAKELGLTYFVRDEGKQYVLNIKLDGKRAAMIAMDSRSSAEDMRRLREGVASLVEAVRKLSPATIMIDRCRQRDAYKWENAEKGEGEEEETEDE